MTFLDLVEQIRLCFKPLCLGDYEGEFGFIVNSSSEIARVGYATNLDESTAEKATQEGVDALLTHHDAWGFLYELRTQVLATLKSASISHCFVHVPLDAAPFGTAASLAEELGLRLKTEFARYDGLACGRICEAPKPQTLDELTARLAEATRAGVRVWQNNTRAIRRVGITTGGGNLTDVLHEAADMGCDTYVTGETNLYTVQYARHRSMNLIVGTHTHTEFPGVESLCNKLRLSTGLEFVPIREEDSETGMQAADGNRS
ncbi:Nif3-like dinuclear metal center hexameric protein [Candidatus Bipolaricaulota bacterium]